jgi:cytochrome c oxidase subunit 2
MKLPKFILAMSLLTSGFLPPLAGAQIPEAPKVIAITVKRFEYTPKEVRLKKGETVTLSLKSMDVTHGMLCRKLKIDTDIPPGQEVKVVVTPREAGTFSAICNHFCGSGHGNMKMTFIVE